MPRDYFQSLGILNHANGHRRLQPKPQVVSNEAIIHLTPTVSGFKSWRLMLAVKQQMQEHQFAGCTSRYEFLKDITHTCTLGFAAATARLQRSL